MWLAEKFAGDELAAQISWNAWIQVGLILAAVPALGALRRLVLGNGAGAKGLADMLLGAVSGVCFAVLVWLLVWGATLHTQDGAQEELREAPSASWAIQLSRGPALLPEALRSSLLNLPLEAVESED